MFSLSVLHGWLLCQYIWGKPWWTVTNNTSYMYLTVNFYQKLSAVQALKSLRPLGKMMTMTRMTEMSSAFLSGKMANLVSWWLLKYYILWRRNVTSTFFVCLNCVGRKHPPIDDLQIKCFSYNIHHDINFCHSRHQDHFVSKHLTSKRKLHGDCRRVEGWVPAPRDLFTSCKP